MDRELVLKFGASRKRPPSIAHTTQTNVTLEMHSRLPSPVGLAASRPQACFARDPQLWPLVGIRSQVDRLLSSSGGSFACRSSWLQASCPVCQSHDRRLVQPGPSSRYCSLPQAKPWSNTYIFRILTLSFATQGFYYSFAAFPENQTPACVCSGLLWCRLVFAPQNRALNSPFSCGLLAC